MRFRIKLILFLLFKYISLSFYHTSFLIFLIHAHIYFIIFSCSFISSLSLSSFSILILFLIPRNFRSPSFRTLVAWIIIASGGLLLSRETMSTRNLQEGGPGLPRFDGSRGKRHRFFVGRDAAFFLSNIVGHEKAAVARQSCS